MDGYQNLFALPVLVRNRYDEELFTKAEASILGMYEHADKSLRVPGLQAGRKEQSERATNKLGDPLNGIEGIDKILDLVKEVGLEYLESMGATKKFLYEKSQYWKSFGWWNVLEGDGWYPWHDHRKCLLSAVVYIRCEEGHAPIKFKSPMLALIENWFDCGRYFAKDSEYMQERTLYCKTGDILIFPSWLDHGVPSKFKDHADSFMHDHETENTQKRVTIALELY